MLLKSFVELVNRNFSLIIISIVRNHLGLNLVKVSANLTIVSSRELFSDLHLHKLTVRLIFSNCAQSEFTIF